MSVTLVSNSYGKSRVRLLKVARDSDVHEIQDLNINIAIEGDFEAIHTTGDNSACLPTDTMKNTVYALAGETRDLETIETFGRRLAAYFLKENEQVSRARIELFEQGWKRMKFEGSEHEHSFVRGSGEKRTARVDASRDTETVESGIEDLVVLKSTRSGFAGFARDKYTTLPETTDRIFSTSVKAVWRYADADDATNGIWQDIRRTILQTFADHDSLSVQHTLYAMGEAVLESYAKVVEIAFSLPNIHCLPVDMTKLGQKNENRIFIPTDEPHGLIEARISR